MVCCAGDAGGGTSSLLPLSGAGPSVVTGNRSFPPPGAFGVAFGSPGLGSGAFMKPGSLSVIEGAAGFGGALGSIGGGGEPPFGKAPPFVTLAAVFAFEAG